MIQQEIFDNMTKGTWIIAGGVHLCISQPDGLIDMAIFENDADWNLKEYRSNRAALVFAINNTYGKSLNPEAYLPIYNILTYLSDKLEGVVIHEIISDIRALLESANLKP